jgi:hypothetical protein
MARRGIALNVSAVCIALFLITLSSSFGGELTNSIGRSPEWAGGGYGPFAESALGFGEDKRVTDSDSSASRYDQSPLANGYVIQASSCAVVTCSYVSKTVMCHRIAHSCPPQLLLPFQNLPQKQTIPLRPFADLRGCPHSRNDRAQGGRSRHICGRPK